jgi:hypothetical protein
MYISKSCIGVCFSFLALILVIFSLSFPWYYESLILKQEANTGKRDSEHECMKLSLRGWFTEYCHTSHNCSEAEKASCKRHVWRNDCPDLFQDGAQNHCHKIIEIYNVSLAFMVVSSLFILLSLVGFCIRCFSHFQRGPFTSHAVVTLLGLGALTVAIMAFALELPKAYKVDTEGCTTGPCKGFWGSKKYEDQVDGYAKIVASWGPAGWVIAVVAWPVLVVMALVSLLPSRDPDYYPIQILSKSGQLLNRIIIGIARRQQRHESHNH